MEVQLPGPRAIGLDAHIVPSTSGRIRTNIRIRTRMSTCVCLKYMDAAALSASDISSREDTRHRGTHQFDNNSGL